MCLQYIVDLVRYDHEWFGVRLQLAHQWIEAPNQIEVRLATRITVPMRACIRVCVCAEHSWQLAGGVCGGGGYTRAI